jgi:serine/threonine protein phosphatase PrpC
MTALCNFGEGGEDLLFGVYDGHGKDGHLCARFVRDHVRFCHDKHLRPGVAISRSVTC